LFYSDVFNNKKISVYSHNKYNSVEISQIYLLKIIGYLILICTHTWPLTILLKDLMQGKLIQKFTHLLYCSVLSLGGNVNTRRMSKPDMGSIFHINNQWNILVIGHYYVHYQNYQNSMLLTSSDIKRTLMHCLQIPRRVYATAINFPCISFLILLELIVYI